MSTAAFVPRLRSDVLRRDIGPEAVVWSPTRAAPVALDAIATVMLGVVDGTGTVEELSRDVADVVGVGPEVAAFRVQRTIEQLDAAGLLVTSVDDGCAPAREPFINPVASCIETSSCTGNVTPVHLEIAGCSLRVASASRRLARKLERALRDHVTGGPAPLGFLIRTSRRHPRRLVIVDRGGFVLGTVEGSSQALAVVLSHLSGLVPPGEDRVRVRARALVGTGGAVVCLWPLLFVPPLDEAELRGAGLAVLDRLSVDVDPATARIVNGGVPWPSGPRAAPVSHVAASATPIDVTRILVPCPTGSAPPSGAEIAASIAREAISGAREDVLDAAAALVRSAPVRAVDPAVATSLMAALRA